MTTSILYISYDGMLEPLGQSQVIAYQKHLSEEFEMHIVSFEKPADWAATKSRSIISQEIAQSGIHWHPRGYHKRMATLATAYDILVGTLTGLWLIFRYGVKLVHARSYVAAVIALIIKKMTGVSYIFDMRGFWADERLDGGLWRRDSILYRVAKWFERELLLNADHVVALTHAALDEMKRFPYLVGRMPDITVIPTCTDLVKFCPQPTIEKEFILGYVGSAGTWYEFDATVACFAELLRSYPDARFLIINRNEHNYIRERLTFGRVPLTSVELRAADHVEMPRQIARMRACIFLIKPLYSKCASSPTKLAEVLGCGIPCLANNGVGDLAAILDVEQVGVTVRDFSPDSLSAGLKRLLDLAAEDGVEARCVNVAHKLFSLNEGVEKYRMIYRALISKSQGVT